MSLFFMNACVKRTFCETLHPYSYKFRVVAQELVFIYVPKHSAISVNLYMFAYMYYDKVLFLE